MIDAPASGLIRWAKPTLFGKSLTRLHHRRKNAAVVNPPKLGVAARVLRAGVSNHTKSPGEEIDVSTTPGLNIVTPTYAGTEVQLAELQAAAAARAFPIVYFQCQHRKRIGNRLRSTGLCGYACTAARF
jgi:hypothetical protein